MTDWATQSTREALMNRHYGCLASALPPQHCVWANYWREPVTWGVRRNISRRRRALTSGDLRAREELVAVKRALGKHDESSALAKAGLADFPLSDFLREETSASDLDQLSNDYNRVLNIASQYIRMGMYAQALNVLSRRYSPVIADQSEPGSVSPQDNPLVVYFRGYCREKLGQSGTEDYKAASRLSTAYIFPSTPEELTVLKAASRSNPADATAHFLLGNLYFSHAETDSALGEWAEARKSGTRLPVLDANIGLALLHIKDDPENALAAFRDGLTNDPTNVAVYLGIDQSLSLLGHPAGERAEALGKYPRLGDAPNPLMFELILNLAESGDFDRATRLFHNHFFPREEGGTNVRQVWVEVQLQRLLALSKKQRCTEALNAAKNLGSEIPELSFTKDGLDPVPRSAADQLICSGPSMRPAAKPRTLRTSSNSAASASSADQSSLGVVGGSKSFRASISNNGKADCRKLWQMRSGILRPAPIRVGGCIRPACSKETWVKSKRRMRGFERRCYFRIGCWHIT